MRNSKIEDTSSIKFTLFQLIGIGIGGIIGAGYFLGCGLGVQEAGPSIVLAFLLGGIIMMQVLGAMTSINVNRLAHGSFRVYTEQFLGSYFGFFLGWVVFINGVFSMSSEALAMAVFIKYWFSSIPIPLAAIAFTLLVILINAFNLRNLGRIEALMAALKILTLVLFIVIGGYALLTKTGFTTQLNVKSIFPNGLSGFLQAMLIVIFSYSGISAVVMASTEVENPRTSIHKATIYMSIGVTVLYVLSMLVLVSILSWTKVSTNQSPFVQAFQALGYSWASTAVNIVILIAAFSVMVATYYSCIHMITSLSESNKAPKPFAKANNKGLYKNSWLLVGILSLLLVSASFFVSQKLFNYLISACSYFTFLNWILNLVTYLVWMKKRHKDEKYSSPLILGRFGAYVTLLVILSMLVISLRVIDFRIGFYSAAIITMLISVIYPFVKRRTNLEK